MIADTHVDSELGKFRRSGRYSVENSGPKMTDESQSGRLYAKRRPIIFEYRHYQKINNVTYR